MSHYRQIFAIFVSILVASTITAARQSPKLDITVETLAPDVYLLRASSDLDNWSATNVTMIVNESDVTVFDSNTRPETARKVIAEIKKITTKPVRRLINSHWHMDHWFGNDEFTRAYPGVEIIATKETRDYMKRMGQDFFADEAGSSLPRMRASLDEAIKTGKLADGSPLTPESRRAREAAIERDVKFTEEIRAVRHVLPTLVYQDALTFWSGNREFRLFSVTGDSTAASALYLPGERILMTGDVLVGQENGNGTPPWTTNSNLITPWLRSLERFDALDTAVIVPGQGPALRDKTYLKLTIELYTAIISQVHAALESGLYRLDTVQARVNVDAIGLKYTPGASAVSGQFKTVVTTLTRKVFQEALDGAGRESPIR